jgi:hypothetical protein
MRLPQTALMSSVFAKALMASGMLGFASKRLSEIRGLDAGLKALRSTEPEKPAKRTA